MTAEKAASGPKRRAIQTSKRRRAAQTQSADAEQASAEQPANDAQTRDFEWVKWRLLRPWPNNPKSYDDDEVTALVESVKRYGWGRPIQANRYQGLEGEIIAGHRALLAAEKLGDAFQARNAPAPGLVPVRWMHLPPKEAHALAMADGNLQKKETDDGKMRKLVQSAELDPLDWATAGYKEAEIRALAFEPWETESSDGGGSSGSRRTKLNYSVIIECEDEDQQTSILERCEAEGLTARPWVGG